MSESPHTQPPKSLCCICKQPATTLILCESCASAALLVNEMVPGQISMRKQGGLDACLVDAWARIYGLSEVTELGRESEEGGIAIHQASISRKHAVLRRESEGNYSLCDLGSTNGTQVGHRFLDEKTLLVSGDLIFLGSVGFYFVSPRPALVSGAVAFATMSVPARTPDANAYPSFEGTDLNDLETVAIQLIEATGGGGGFVDVAGTQIQLSLVQLELMKLLMKRMERDRAKPAAVRGYLHSSEILAAISWDTAHPSDNHVKQLVRRLRRSLARSGRDVLVQSQQGLGYRLSVRPSAT